MNEKILAVSAGHEITESELNAVIANYPPEQQIYLSDPNAKSDLLEQLIGFHLFAKMAEDEKIKESSEYKEMLARMERELASHMAATSVIEQVTVENDEVTAYYEANKEKFMTGEQVRAKHILVDALDTAEKIAKEIEEGKSFEDAAKEYSTCPSKDRGGDLGLFSKGQMVPEFEAAAFSSEIGALTGPVKTNFGYHLILVVEKKEAQIQTLEEQKEKLTEQILQQKKQNAYMNKVKELESKYGVERKDA